MIGAMATVESEELSVPRGSSLAATGRVGQLAAALAVAQGRCRAVAPDRRNQFHKYDYASAEAVIGEAKDALADSGLSLLPIEQNINGHSKDGEDRYELERKFLLLHSSGECLPISLHWPVVVEKGRPLDKAAAAAATSSLAYLLRDLLMMPRVKEADDISAREDRPQPQEQAGKRAAPARTIGASQFEELQQLVHKSGRTWARAMAWLGLAESAEWQTITLEQFTRLKEACASAIAEKPAPPQNGKPAANAEPQAEEPDQLPDPAEVIGAAEVRELQQLMKAAGRVWADCQNRLRVASQFKPTDLCFEQYGRLRTLLQQDVERRQGQQKAG